MQADKHTDTDLHMHAFSEDTAITTCKLKIPTDNFLINIDIYIYCHEKIRKRAFSGFPLLTERHQ